MEPLFFILNGVVLVVGGLALYFVGKSDGQADSDRRHGAQLSRLNSELLGLLEQRDAAHLESLATSAAKVPAPLNLPENPKPILELKKAPKGKKESPPKKSSKKKSK